MLSETQAVCWLTDDAIRREVAHPQLQAACLEPGVRNNFGTYRLTLRRFVRKLMRDQGICIGRKVVRELRQCGRM